MAGAPAFDVAVAWSDCGNGFECGTLNVPVDWRQPAGEQVGLALVRHPATFAVRAHRVAGGELRRSRRVRGQLPAHHVGAPPPVVQARFDVVSFDPRGTGASRPIDCVDDAFLDLSAGLATIPNTVALLDTVHTFNAQFAAGCVERMGAYAGQVGTRNVARDVEAIRVALGEPKLDYLGYSYGTIVGITYAQMFPATIRSMVLDAPPDYWLSARDYAHQQAGGFMNALGAFLDWCQQTNCSLASTGPPRDVLQQLIARVDQQPLPASYTADGVTRDGVLTPSLLQSGVSPCSTTARAGGRSSPTRSPKRCSRAKPRASWRSPTGSSAAIRTAAGTRWWRPTRSSGASTDPRSARRAPQPSSPTSPGSRPSCRRGVDRGARRRAWACPSRRRATPSAR